MENQPCVFAGMALELSRLRGDIDRKADPILVSPQGAHIIVESADLESCLLARIYPVNGVIISLHIPDLLR
jgi:hypothetical protein